MPNIELHVLINYVLTKNQSRKGKKNVNEKCKKKQDDLRVSRKHVLKYFRSFSIEVPRPLIPKSDCDRDQWIVIQNQAIAHSTSRILKKIFQKYTTFCCEEYRMTPQNLSEFLQTYQKECFTSFDPIQTMRIHMGKVISIAIIHINTLASIPSG